MPKRGDVPGPQTGSSDACSEYLLSPFCDWDNDELVALHKAYLPTPRGRACGVAG